MKTPWYTSAWYLLAILLLGGLGIWSASRGQNLEAKLHICEARPASSCKWTDEAVAKVAAEAANGWEDAIKKAIVCESQLDECMKMCGGKK